MSRVINVPIIAYVDVEVDEENFESAVKNGCINSYEYWQYDEREDLRDGLNAYERLVGRSPFEDMYS